MHGTAVRENHAEVIVSSVLMFVKCKNVLFY